MRVEPAASGACHSDRQLPRPCRPHADMTLVIDLYMERRLDLDAIITRERALDGINEAFAAI